MALVTDSGITPKTLEEYQTELRVAFQASFGEDIDLDPKSPQGQWVDNIALSMSQSDDAVISIAGATNIFRAFKSQLEGLGALLGINKDDAESTIVIATLGGTPGAIIPSGARAKSASGDLYSLDDDATIGVGGTIDSRMSAVAAGPLGLLTGELSNVVDVEPGWETVTNAADGATGRNIESDGEYRNRYFRELFRNALSVLDSIVGQVSSVDNVIDVVGAENDTSSPIVDQGVTIDPHSVAIVVDGGLDVDIKDAIRFKKTGGTGTTGTTVVPDPPHTDINFFRASFISIRVAVTTIAGIDFPPDGAAQIKQRIFDYVNGGFSVGGDLDFFELDGMKISEDMYKHRLYTPLNSIPGHSVTILFMEDKADPGDTDAIIVDLNEKVQIESLDDITVSIT